MNTMTSELDESKMDEVLKGYNIPPQPKIMIEVMNESAKPEPSLVLIADTISGDVGLASAVLKTINSPLLWHAS